jgi:hypothetical protein
MKKQSTNNKLFEYRIKYNVGKDVAAINNYHYYMAESAQQALSFHDFSLKHKHVCAQNLSIERYNPYSDKWENESDSLSNQDVDYCNEN